MARSHLAVAAVAVLLLGVALAQSREQAAAASPRSSTNSDSTCTTDDDCQLNGECVAGACRCDVAWADGGRCAHLQLKPMAMTACGPGCAYHGSASQDTSNSWGGNVVRADGAYHMYAADFANNCSLGTWRVNSMVAHAVADAPEGPYTRVDTAVPLWSHNPQVVEIPGPTPLYVLYHLGNGTVVQPVENCNHTAGHTTGAAARAARAAPGGYNETTRVHVASSVNGPWAPVAVDFVGLGGPRGDNPAPLVFPNGTVRLMVLAGLGGHVVLEAPTWRGPYVRVSAPYTVRCSVKRFKWCAEDEFLYRDPRGNWHALFHMFDVTPETTPSWTGGHAFSRDGIVWSNVSQAFNTTLTTVGHPTIYAQRRERPKLLFDDAGWPTHLFNGVQVPGYGTYTMVQAIPVPPPAAPHNPSAAAAGAEAGCRDRFLWPFASTSIWNTPVGSGAQYVPGNLFQGDKEAPILVQTDADSVLRASASDPLTPWYNQGWWGPPPKPNITHCNVTQPTPVMHIPLPYNWTTANFTSGNHATALLLPDNRTILQMQPTFRCTPGSPLLSRWGNFTFGHPYPLETDILGEGIGGAHGGSGLSAIGGTVRAGELDPANTAGIRHALKLELYGHLWYYNKALQPSSPTNFGHTHYVWPATCSDFSSATDYHGTNPHIAPGALLAIPPAVNRTLPPSRTFVGGRIREALVLFGAYLVDSSSGYANKVSLCMEPAVDAEMPRLFNVSMAFPHGVNPGYGRDLYLDFVDLLRALHAVANNAPDSIGGGGTPLTAPAPPICGA